MARSRKRKKPQAQAAKSQHWQQLLHWAKKDPPKALGVLTALIGGISTLVYGLGLFALRSREGLLGLPGTPLDYPHEDSVLTGLSVIGRLPLDALASLLVGNLWLLISAWASLASVTLLAFLGRRPQHGPWRWVPFILVVLALFFGLRFQIAALFPAHIQDAEAYPSFEVNLHGGPAAEVTFESISWLTNETQANVSHRQALNGITSWFLVVALTGIWAAWRQRNLTPWKRHALLALFVLLAALAMRPVPRSYAYARWGISYPLAAVKESCNAELSAAIEDGRCCAYDVTAKGTPPTTLQRGDCPASTKPLFRWKKDQSECLSPTGRPKVIDDDC